MPNYICLTCGVQYGETPAPPAHCILCEDERQFVGWEGQQWTTLEELRANHTNRFTEMEPRLIRLGTEPLFGIGQHAYLVQAPSGNVLWDCITLIDEATIEKVRALGGISAMAISHPHYYSTIVEWSAAFDQAPIFIHAGDRQWVTRPSPNIVFWEGKIKLLGEDLTLIHSGGYFEGSAMLHWAGGAEGRGVLLAGDTIQVVYDRRYVSFMYSFVNYIPLPAAKVRHVVEANEFQERKRHHVFETKAVDDRVRLFADCRSGSSKPLVCLGSCSTPPTPASQARRAARRRTISGRNRRICFGGWLAVRIGHRLFRENQKNSYDAG